jgi:NitT/TauT family transport system permease protein
MTVLSRPVLSRPGRVARKAGLGLAGTVALLGLLQVAEGAAGVNQALFPLPSAVLAQAWDLTANGSFWSAAGATLAAWGEGTVLTGIIAVPLGLALGSVPVVESALTPVFEFLRPVPAVVIFPLALLVAKDNTRAQVSVVVFSSVWPVLVNTIYGLREVDPVAKQTLRAFGFGPLAVALRVSLPSAAPFIMTGIKIAASLAFIVTVAIEIVGTGYSGLGAYAAQSQAGGGDIAALLAVAVWAGLIGLAVHGAFTAVQRRGFGWHQALTAAAAEDS